MELTVQDFLQLSELEGVRLAGGANGTDRVITRTNIIDNPDTLEYLSGEQTATAEHHPGFG